MRKLLLSAILLSVACRLFALTFSVDNIHYEVINTANHTVKVVADYPEYTDVVVIPSTVSYGAITYSVTEIDEFAFQYCFDLKEVSIPSSVTTISPYAFLYAYYLAKVTVNWSLPPVIDAEVFEGIDLGDVTLVVPFGTLSIYQTASVWQNFNVIQSLSTGLLQIENSDLSAYVSHGELVLNSVAIGEPVVIYTVNGVFVYRTVFAGQAIALPTINSGVYMVRVGNHKRAKFVIF